MRHILTSVVLAVALSAGCAGTVMQLPAVDAGFAAAEAERQRIVALEDYRDNLERAMSVYYGLVAANADICDDTRAGVGAIAIVPQDFGVDFRSAAATVFGVSSDLPTFVFVVEGGPARDAGILPGDTLISLGGELVSAGTRGRDLSVERYRSLASNGPVTAVVRRSGQFRSVTVVPEPTCAYGLVLLQDETVNAYADDDNVIVTTGIVRFARTDDELALILGHELAHNSLDHVEKKIGNAVIGAVIGALIGALVGVDMSDIGAQAGAGMFSQEFESEADYVGTYFTARAGHKTDDVADVWRRMSTLNPAAIHLAGTSHPSTAMRFLAIEQTAHEIVSKQSSGVPLVPNLVE